MLNTIYIKKSIEKCKSQRQHLKIRKNNDGFKVKNDNAKW